jgi:hypothetical protein
VIVSCGSCLTELPPAAPERCPSCGSIDILVGMYAPNGARISMQRDAPRMRVQGRCNRETGDVMWESIVGPESRPSDLARSLNNAPHIRLYSDILWNNKRNRLERREQVYDNENKYKRQEWFHLETGEQTWIKEGDIDDPELRGESARRGKQP